MEPEHSGEVINIYLRSKKRAPVTEVDTAEARRGSGLVGDHKKGGKRQVTVLSSEAWEAACNELGVAIDPGMRRANILTRGVDLRKSMGKHLRLGEIVLEIIGETDPCERMDEAEPGLMRTLTPDLRGGVFGRVLQAGVVKVGDSAVIELAP